MNDGESAQRRAKGLNTVLVALAAGLLDQLTKVVMLRNLHPGEAKQVIPNLFNLTLHFNKGAAFGIMAEWEDGTRQVALALTTIFALLCVTYFLFRDYFDDWIGRSALALILGGACGNLVDRFVHGEVVDFLDFYIGSYHWPAFNLADSCIFIGVVILLLRPPKRQQKNAAAA